jgi:cobalt/nickel transport system permease protein
MMDFIEKTLKEVSSFIAHALTPAPQGGILSEVKPFTYLIASLSLIITSILVSSPAPLAFIIISALPLAWASGIKLREFIKREYSFIPLFTTVIALPAIFNFVTPGHEVVSIEIAGRAISVTYEGVESAVMLLLRVIATTSFIVMVSLKYDPADIAESLKSFRLPSLLIDSIHLMMRHSLTLARITAEMIDARRARTVGREPTLYSWRRWGEAVGALYIRSIDLSEKTYKAMRARGYGHLSSERFKVSVGRDDIILLTIASSVIIVSLMMQAMIPW